MIGFFIYYIAFLEIGIPAQFHGTQAQWIPVPHHGAHTVPPIFGPVQSMSGPTQPNQFRPQQKASGTRSHIVARMVRSDVPAKNFTDTIYSLTGLSTSVYESDPSREYKSVFLSITPKSPHSLRDDINNVISCMHQCGWKFERCLSKWEKQKAASQEFHSFLGSANSVHDRDQLHAFGNSARQFMSTPRFVNGQPKNWSPAWQLQQ